MEMTGAPWFIDAWAVHDGRVFASLRRPDSIDATVTVFLSVPDLEPVPVGRISTALRGTRSGFQEGLRDAQGAEIPFETLTQVRDLVRRAYLAAGLGPGAPGAAGGPLLRPDDVGPGAGSAFLEQEGQPRGDPRADRLVGCPRPRGSALAGTRPSDRSVARRDPGWPRSTARDDSQHACG
jgi:hypothetical protein